MTGRRLLLAIEVVMAGLMAGMAVGVTPPGATTSWGVLFGVAGAVALVVGARSYILDGPACLRARCHLRCGVLCVAMVYMLVGMSAGRAGMPAASTGRALLLAGLVVAVALVAGADGYRVARPVGGAATAVRVAAGGQLVLSAATLYLLLAR